MGGGGLFAREGRDDGDDDDDGNDVLFFFGVRKGDDPSEGFRPVGGGRGREGGVGRGEEMTGGAGTLDCKGRSGGGGRSDSQPVGALSLEAWRAGGARVDERTPFFSAGGRVVCSGSTRRSSLMALFF